MDTVREKLELITDFWNHYVWNYKTIQNKILWNDEVKTNYYGDILSYFTDTFNLIKANSEESNYENNIFYATGLMQIIYVHQDLTDELLRIFKLPKSTLTDKKPNRTIRNELIGHPISRNQDFSLKSSTFWGRKLSGNTLHYIKYSQSTQFQGKSQTYSIADLISSHKEYLNKYFNAILKKINAILKGYNKQIIELEKMIDNNVEFKNIVTLTFQIHEFISQQDYLYTPETLLECKKKEKEHERYKYVVNDFLTILKFSIKETKSDIIEYKTKVFGKKNKDITLPKIKIVFSRTEKADIDLSNRKRNYSYEMEKLHSKHPVFYLDYFEDEFKDYPKMLEEINNMKINFHNKLEYYASYNYLRNLLTQEKLL